MVQIWKGILARHYVAISKDLAYYVIKKYLRSISLINYPSTMVPLN